MKPSFTHGKAIEASHPCSLPDDSPEQDLAFAADALAMKLVGERHEKRDLVNLVRWLIMRKPEGLVQVEQPKRPLPAGTIISYDAYEAVVIHDDGGKTLTVMPEGETEEQNWFWTLGGITCKVVAPAGRLGD